MKITSIFYSIDGEVNSTGGAGVLTTFIRFAGCNLRCWKSTGGCDTTYSYDVSKATEMTVKEVLIEVVKNFPCQRVTITGGEPGTQMEALVELTKALTDLGYRVSIETNGSIDVIPMKEAGASIVMDYKSPSTEMESLMKLSNVIELDGEDWIKFVIADEKDYLNAVKIIGACETEARIAFSPKYGTDMAKQVVEWIKRDKLVEAVVQLQLHKVIWPEKAMSAKTGDEV